MRKVEGKTIGLGGGKAAAAIFEWMEQWKWGRGLACAFWPSQIWKQTTKYYWRIWTIVVSFCEFGNVAKIEVAKMPILFAKFIKKWLHFWDETLGKMRSNSTNPFNKFLFLTSQYLKGFFHFLHYQINGFFFPFPFVPFQSKGTQNPIQK
jgi:hypothetical protein